MPSYEYKVVPAPRKGRKAKGLKSNEGMFSFALQELMNELSERGWEYQRAEMLPSIERSGLASTTTEWRHVLVFRRPRSAGVEAFAPELLPPPQEVPTETATPAPAQAAQAQAAPDLAASPQTAAKPPAAKDDTDPDNGVETTEDVMALSTTLEKLAASRKAVKTTP